MSPSFFFAGSSGANRRGRTGCDMLFTDRVARKQIRMLLAPDGLQRPLSWLECRDMMAFMLVGLYKPVSFWKWVRLQPQPLRVASWASLAGMTHHHDSLLSSYQTSTARSSIEKITYLRIRL